MSLLMVQNEEKLLFKGDRKASQVVDLLKCAGNPRERIVDGDCWDRGRLESLRWGFHTFDDAVSNSEAS